jgi:hypothetical protein
MFKQTIILGYPPFLKGVIDTGLAQMVPWSTYNLKMVFAGEVFSEEWRALVASRAGIQDPLTDMVSIYGTADAGVLACETPFSARVRKWISKRPDVARQLFGKDRLPSLMQYDPGMYVIFINLHLIRCADVLNYRRYMELHRDEGTLVFSSIPTDLSNNTNTITAPLIR